MFAYMMVGYVLHLTKTIRVFEFDFHNVVCGFKQVREQQRVSTALIAMQN